MATKPNEKQRKVLAIVALAELFGRTLSDPGVRMYVEAMADVSASEVERAATVAASTCKMLPAPVELRELAGIARPEDRALLAWMAVEKAVAKVGAYKTVDFDDPIINAAIRSMGGWDVLCGKPVEEFDKWARQDFLKAYASLSRAGVTGDMCQPLPGLARSGVVRRLDGTQARIEPQVIPVATGLPWAGETPKRVAAPRKKAPALLTFQKA